MYGCFFEKIQSAYSWEKSYRIYLTKLQLYKKSRVTMAEGIHLFPSRTQKLSLLAPMVLIRKRIGRVGSRSTNQLFYRLYLEIEFVK